MHEHTYEPSLDGPVPASTDDGPGQLRTGDPAVDAVLEEVAGVASVPVAEHVPVFEHAHEALRRALDPGADA